jgi:hypothetical protein
MKDKLLEIDLKAAAPDLYNALKNMVREWCEIVGDESVNSTPADTLEHAREALAKAEGARGYKAKYPAYANWHVTTEGDCEGRTTTNLGVHTGFIDEIAFRLGRKACYSLKFKHVSDEEKPEPKPVNAVSVQLDIDSGTWDMSRPERAKHVREILQGREVVVEEGQFYASVMLRKPPDEEGCS